MDESGEHHSQQTDTRTKNEILHVLTHRWVLNNETHRHREGSSTHWGLLGGIGEGQWGVGSWGESMGEMPDIGEGKGGSKSHCHMCTYATILHVLHIYPKT